MRNLKDFKKVKEIQAMFYQSKLKDIDDIKVAVSIEKQYIFQIQRLISYAGNLKFKVGENSTEYIETQSLISEIKTEILKISNLILDQFNQEYRTAFKLEEILNEHKGFYLQHGIIETLHSKGIIDDLFQQLLEKMIPDHPKDEYSETRKMKRKFIIHTGPTNSGKTFDALTKLKSVNKGIYLSPLRLLALEVFEKLNVEGTPCHLLTGEENIQVPNGNHIACTVEKAIYSETFDVAVIDESQLINNKQRGFAWVRAILGIKAEEVHVICSPNAVHLIKQLIEDCGDEVTLSEKDRQTPLIIEDNSFQFPHSVEDGDALIVFSRKMALQVAAVLSTYGIKSSVIYGNLPPETRRKQVDLFIEGKTKVVVSTDAIGMGLNLPIRRVVFLEMTKFDGTKERELDTQEIKQIAGRAGRKGMYNEGYVNCVRNKHELHTKLFENDSEINMAYISPMDSTILNLPFGTLKERLLAWANYPLQVPYFDKIDISEQLQLLDLADSYEGQLTDEQIYRAIQIPFNQKEKPLLKLWFKYMDCLLNYSNQLPKPEKEDSNLQSLETYYRAINLYYSFGKAFNIAIDVEWIMQEREKISQEIHVSLKDNNVYKQRKCRSCRKKLKWNELFDTCNKCFNDKKAFMYSFK